MCGLKLGVHGVVFRDALEVVYEIGDGVEVVFHKLVVVLLIFFGLPPFLPLRRATADFFADFMEPSATAAGFLDMPPVLRNSVELLAALGVTARGELVAVNADRNIKPEGSTAPAVVAHRVLALIVRTLNQLSNLFHRKLIRGFY